MNRSIMFTQWCITVHIGKFDRWYSGPAVYVCTLIVQPPAQQLRKKKKFRSSRFKSPVEKKIQQKQKNSLSSRAMCGRVRRVRALRSRVQSSHMDTSSAHTRKKRKKISRPCTVSWLSAENCFSLLTLLTVPVQVQLISFYPPPKKKNKNKKSERFHLDHCCTNDIRCLAVVYTAHQKNDAFHLHNLVIGEFCLLAQISEPMLCALSPQ